VRDVEGYFFLHRPLWHLIGTGVLERHPRLQVVFTELGASWAPRVLAHMDHGWEKNRANHRAFLRHKPSIYYRMQCWIGATAMTRTEVAARIDIGIQRLMWGTDHPHQNGGWGERTALLQATFGEAGVQEQEARLMLGENAARLYNFDVDKLIALVERVGPQVKEILTHPGSPYQGHADIDRPGAY
jgi:predicted TIM-barrel fold metal-dependent hydrolase